MFVYIKNLYKDQLIINHNLLSTLIESCTGANLLDVVIFLTVITYFLRLRVMYTTEL
jgi:hypothetical protein